MQVLDFEPTTVTLFWADARASAYEVEWKRADATVYNPLTLKSTVMKKKNMEGGESYHFRVKAVGDVAFSEPLVWAHPTIDGAQPPAPTVALEIMPTDVQLVSATIQWPAIAASPKYEVQHLLMDGASEWTTATSTVTSTAIKKKNLGNSGHPYAFRYRAYGLDRWGVWSRAAGPIMPPTPALALAKALAPSLLSTTGDRVPSATLGGKVIGLYFSAHWCGPCRQFTPMLAQFYQSMKRLGRPFEVVFVSADHDAKQFTNYFRDMPWLAVPYDSSEREELQETHQIQGIPTFKILNSAGQVVDNDARQRPMNEQTFDAWYAQCYRH
ncbi:hypothetical protein SPRG_21383 [Saprolegnia parasitica CBS 223.65]|uniref:protein-disulfide reductase n=1 Tax=Saprolegnia parasitica (strain CBS 223.65) TaxID=695850 RepID=A0A067C0C2_SAPPC|nr:hypothetical protein SPRG_21383 [Saprolegnia parasitica CBS 223.65]KDO20021.1 hypothetical protein SPRG_21383 [Saprolegnia parasitica CBS 223.65]|eukprot:XP_012209282.1 hypothetical protein SPRG_21383 [Saprolegnia parasitica CBS 223.65]